MSSMPRLMLIPERALMNVKVDEENRQAERVTCCCFIISHFSAVQMSWF